LNITLTIFNYVACVSYWPTVDQLGATQTLICLYNKTVWHSGIVFKPHFNFGRPTLTVAFHTGPHLYVVNS